jgi:hypothetical protein
VLLEAEPLVLLVLLGSLVLQVQQVLLDLLVVQEPPVLQEVEQLALLVLRVLLGLLVQLEPLVLLEVEPQVLLALLDSQVPLEPLELPELGHH